MPENRIQIILEVFDKTKEAFSELQKAIKGAEENTKKMAETNLTLGKSSSVIGEIKTSWLELAAKFAIVTGAFYSVKSVVEGFHVAVKAAAASTNEIGRSAGILGITVTEFQRLAFVAKMADVSIEEFGLGMKLLSRNMEDAAQGTGQAKKWFDVMGISVKDSSGNLKSLDVIMGEVADKFAGWADGPRKIAVALDLFGRSGERMIPVLNQGKVGFESWMEKGEKLGAILSPELVKKGSEIEDSFKKMNTALQALKTTFLVMLTPISNFGEKIGEATKKIIEFYSNPTVQAVIKLLSFATPLGSLQHFGAFLSGEYNKEKVRGEFYGEKKVPLPQPSAMPDEETLKLEQKALEENSKAVGDWAQPEIDALEKMQMMKVEATKASIAEDLAAENKSLDDNSVFWGVWAQIRIDALHNMQMMKVEATKASIAEDLEAEKKSLEENSVAVGVYAQAILDAKEKLQLIIVEQQKQKWEEIAHNMEAIGASIGNIWTSNIQAMLKGTESLADGIKKIFTDMADYAISMILKIAMNFALMGNAKGEWQAGKGLIGIIGSALGFAEGGISLGWKPIAAFQEGGIATRPTLGMIGEGGPEAFVPLKGGRIPVEMSGGGNTIIVHNYNTNIEAMDTISVRDFIQRNPGPFIEVISSDLGDKGSTYQALTRRRQ